MKTRKIDGIRRKSDDPARKAWYAKQRTIRYARYLSWLATK